ncbi:unnamed protein product [Urochloa humidicola]
MNTTRHTRYITHYATAKAPADPEPQEMGSNPAAADLTVALIPAPAGSGGSSSSAVVQPRRNAYSVLQLVRALFYGAPAIPVLEDGHPAGAEERQLAAIQGRVRGVVVGTMNTYLRACGRIPMLCPEASLLDLNAGAALAPPERGGGGVPVTCAYCHRVFCIGVYEVPWLNPPPGHVFPELPAPAAASVVTPPAVVPYNVVVVGGALPGPSNRATTPVAVLQVCSNPRHFMVRLGRLRMPNNATSLVWRRPSSLGIVPAVVVSGAAGSGRLQRRHAAATAAPPLEAASNSAGGGANRDFVMPGDEGMVQLSLRQNHHDPLKLTLGWRR